jgi:hypothetical protein
MLVAHFGITNTEFVRFQIQKWKPKRAVMDAETHKALNRNRFYG